LNEVAITIIALFLLGGALAKSANIPLHSWLPGSMEAPLTYLKLFFLFQFILQNLLYLFNLDLSFFIILVFLFPVRGDYKLRDSKGRFRTLKQEKIKPIIPLSKEIIDPLIGNLLGDGSLRFTHKDLNGKPKLNTNALYAITLKNKDYIYHL
jgi:hypothetical protein